MNGLFWSPQIKRWMFAALFYCPAVVLLLGWSWLTPAVVYALFFLAIPCLFFAVRLSLPKRVFITRQVPVSSPAALEVQVPQREIVKQPPLRIPRTATQVFVTMSPTDFEIFSAAIIIGGAENGRGYRFVGHTGKANDRGVDTRLHNHVNLPVVVQAKLHSPDNKITGPEMRKFVGTVQNQGAVGGYYVTTTTFTRAAILEARTHGFISLIDNQRLQALLQQYHYDIAVAYQEILHHINT